MALLPAPDQENETPAGPEDRFSRINTSFLQAITYGRKGLSGIRVTRSGSFPGKDAPWVVPTNGGGLI